MSSSPSPLRYPGGKHAIKNLVTKIIERNGLQQCVYVEPYAGGCGLALGLLFDGLVSRIWINDVDPAIWAFWYSVINHTSGLIGLIDSTEITVGEWQRQKLVFENACVNDPLRLGFATFFLNRVNRSGIIKGAGVIGGKAQLGKYKLDCRFNKEVLIKKIERVSRYADQIELFNLDAMELLEISVGKKGFFHMIDPPYYQKGKMLYTNFYSHDDHEQLASFLRAAEALWIVTYDKTPEIEEMYSNCDTEIISARYSLQRKRQGAELLISSSFLH